MCVCVCVCVCVCACVGFDVYCVCVCWFLYPGALIKSAITIPTTTVLFLSKIIKQLQQLFSRKILIGQ